MPTHLQYLVAIGIDFATVFVEFLGAHMTGSHALWGDALHMFLDNLPLVIAFAAFLKHQKGSGSTRLEFWVSFLNILLLFGGATWILKEGWDGFWYPKTDILWLPTVLYGTVGLAGSLFLAIFFHNLVGGHKHEHTRRGMVLHYAMDALSSIAVIIGAIAYAFGYTRADAVASWVVALTTLWAACDLTRALYSETKHHH